MSQELLSSPQYWRVFNDGSRNNKSVVERILAHYGLLIGCLLVIVSVSIFDTYLVYQFRDQILFAEKNPICLTLIKYDSQHLTWFFLGKFLGNLFVASLLITMSVLNYRHRHTVSLSVAGFQLSLLVYLICADHTTGFLHFEGLFSNGAYQFRVARNALIAELTGLIIVGAAIYAGYNYYRLCVDPRCQNVLEESPLN